MLAWANLLSKPFAAIIFDLSVKEIKGHPTIIILAFRFQRRFNHMAAISIMWLTSFEQTFYHKGSNFDVWLTLL